MGKGSRNEFHEARDHDGEISSALLQASDMHAELEDESPAERRECLDTAQWSSVGLRYVVNGSLYLVWFAISTAVILNVKFLVSSKGHFPYPLAVTACVNGLMALHAFVVSKMPGVRVDEVTASQFRYCIIPISLVTALEIGGTNYALKLLSVSFAQMVKAGGPFSVMIFALFFKLEKFSCVLLFSLVTICGGLAIASWGQIDFQWTGFIVAFVAVFMGGLRWALTQLLLQGMFESYHHLAGKGEGEGEGEEKPARRSARPRLSPLTMTLYTSPLVSLALLPATIIFESGGVVAVLRACCSPPSYYLILSASLFFSSILVFCLMVIEFVLVRNTSSLAVSVGSVFKEICTIAAGIVVFGDHLTMFNVIGFVTCQAGIATYIFMHYRDDKKQQSLTDDEAADLKPVVMHSMEGEANLREELIAEHE
ncbi:hypothetical protein GUITHDRAFT_140559 [Guillardia theta CCMP2712]|uniref:Sugar phosphate transporter domain-containing protein n=2 Tax=Guillardia theta TaxID=55529 RepID=L1J3Z1_GUITC|nr:hypothetical protein GUITHDRAFT_140559 [Guillardia theta CCMP2712]EKX43236.1 hypothetical protein GUITHDRAFT_140559 [Guillardia theta CCMP2712]|eukprot:XP_005830216.1 hypothetical protein GUITHDRAFT_140559 [Guillardia theta CCMP2712]